MHDRDLIQQLNAYARGKYATAYGIAYEGYEHMFAVAQALASAIGPTIAARLPKGGVQTGGGGMARTGEPLAGHTACRDGAGGASCVGVCRPRAQLSGSAISAPGSRRRRRAGRPVSRFSFRAHLPSAGPSGALADT